MSTTTDGTNNDDGARSVMGWLGAGREARRAHAKAVVHQSASVLLGYPDQDFFERLPLVARAVAELPKGTARTELLEFCEHASSTPELELSAHYVDVFDLRRRQALHMTYYTDGDTRRRGHALAEIKRVYAEAGWRVQARELPDHLAVMLEFAARGDADSGQELLMNHRCGLDLLGEALRTRETPYTRVIEAVRCTLPVPRRADEERMRRLAAQGPPAEDVGMEPYGARPRVPLPLTDVSRRRP